MMSLSQVVGQDQDERTDQRQGHNTYKDRRHKGGNGALSMQVRLLNVYTNVIWRFQSSFSVLEEKIVSFVSV
ncbi:Amidase [Fusarium oxysporum f. sp. albedinis]|nr:Amidase [Fusarium oxysporum f. sp. albedinis]